MDPSSRYIRFLSPVPAFAGLDPAQLKRLYGFTALKVLAKGEAATVARVCVAELAIVVSGRVGERGKEPDAEEFGPGAVLEAQAFFTQRPAAATLIALRETVLLTLGWDDLAAAFHAHPDLLACCFAGIGVTAAPAPGKAARLVFCPAGAKGRLDAEAKSALVSALETLAEVRILRRESFGSLALDAPETAHWLQEQELEFDVTVIVAEGADDGFAKEAIGEADEILFIASSGSSILSPLEQYALEQRGKEHCRLAIAKSKGMSLKNAAEWLLPRPYRSTQFVDFASPAAVALTASALIGKGHAVAATSRGVYAAAILGALQAFEANGAPAVSLCAAGSAVLPAGLLACGASLAETETAFRELANPLLWKRAARADAGLYEAAPIDNVLASALPGWNIGLAGRPFAAVSLSLSKSAANVQREGRVHGAVRVGLTPPGMLAPVISEDGDILVSGENEIEALIGASMQLSASPLLLLHPSAPPPGASGMSYRQLAGGSSFRLTPFSPAAPDKRVRLESVLGASCGKSFSALPQSLGAQSFAIPIPEGVSPMDWAEWARLRDSAFEWTSAEIEARRLAQA
jgi:NTE family protein